jgi:hypothetical protein
VGFGLSSGIVVSCIIACAPPGLTFIFRALRVFGASNLWKAEQSKLVSTNNLWAQNVMNVNSNFNLEALALFGIAFTGNFFMT